MASCPVVDPIVQGSLLLAFTLRLEQESGHARQNSRKEHSRSGSVYEIDGSNRPSATAVDHALSSGADWVLGMVVVVNWVTLDGVMQGPGRPDEDTLA